MPLAVETRPPVSVPDAEGRMYALARQIMDEDADKQIKRLTWRLERFDGEYQEYCGSRTPTTGNVASGDDR